ncbi:MAG: DMT family transporter [Bacteroidetes bacterium]|jgi:drug/metabolite transporter (DMT)-like permease|nr:DMT family transporter [Bacteroidota bacterium]
MNSSLQVAPNRWAAPLILLLLGFVWGSSFILMKMGLFARDGSALFPPTQLAALRMAIAGVTLLPIGLKHFRRLTPEQWKWVAIVGVVGSFIPALLFAIAQTQLPSAVAGMLNALTPLWTLLIAIAVFGVHFHRGQLIGLGFGLIGTIGLIWNPEASFEAAWGSGALLVLATICYGTSVNITREKLQTLKGPVIASCSLGLVSLPAAIWFLTGDIPSLIATHPDGLRGFIAIVALAAFGTAGALVLFNQVIAWTNSVFAASVTYIIPVFATFWGWMDGESLRASHLIAGSLILVGVWITHRAGRAAKRSSNGPTGAESKA